VRLVTFLPATVILAMAHPAHLTSLPYPTQLPYSPHLTYLTHPTHLAYSAHQEEFARLEGEALRALGRETESFQGRAGLVERLESAANRAPGPDERGRLALLWLRSLRWLLASIPFRAAEQDPYRRWLAEHDMLAVYSEPAGEWLVNPDAVWRVHDTHRAAAAADEIAWFAVTNGYPGECEGYVPCYANILNWLDGEYLRRHPKGRHASEAVEQVRSSLDEALKNLSGPDARDFFSPDTDCGDLRAGLEPLRRAVVNSNGRRGTEAIALIDRLMSRC
jgi:hypothetical protein